MADVTAIFGILLFLGVIYPGMLLAWWLLFPNIVQRAQTRIECTPWRSFWLGLGVAVILSIPIIFLFALPFGPAKFLGICLLALVLGIATLGAAGLAARMGDELHNRTDGEVSNPGAFVRGALALELAAAFPLIGWFIFIPLSTILTLGASTYALLRWMPAQENKRLLPAPGSVEEAVEMETLANETPIP